MTIAIDEQVLYFYDALFEAVFSKPFQEQIEQPRKKRAVTRQVEEATDAASQSLTRFFLEDQSISLIP